MAAGAFLRRLVRSKWAWFSRKGHRGAVAVTVTALMVVLIAMGSLAVDVAYLVVIRNQLQNAADAGALAGTRVLYLGGGTSVNAGANAVAAEAAMDNLSQGVAVEVQDPTTNENDVQRGHWSFATRTFTPNDSLQPVDLWNRSTQELDADPDFINAVRVRARREDIPAQSFLSRIVGYDNFELQAEAVGYIGFAGTLFPEDVDQPIAICRQAITDADGNYSCNTGRMIDSGGGTTHNTAAWSNFSQPCQTASAQSVRPLICSGGNPDTLFYGNGMGTTGGMQDNVYRDLRDCWLNDPDLAKDWRGYPIEVWPLRLPVIDCPGNNPGPCSQLVGVVEVSVVFVKESGADPQWTDIPLQMEGWECSLWVAAGRPENINALTSTQRQQCWSEFGTEFNLQTANGTSVGTLTPSDLQKTMFFLPSCEAHEPAGNTGGQNFGVLARVPVLVD
jgi:Flp pilus assembly protein TadG